VQPNRVVAILTPLLAPLVGFLVLKLGDAGIDFGDSTDDIVLQGLLFLGGAGVVVLKSSKWMKGWQAWEARQDKNTQYALNESYKLFLENVAKQTGVKLPGEIIQGARNGEFSGDPTPVAAVEPQPPPAHEPGAFQGVEPGQQ
jgi:hypothetical protein